VHPALEIARTRRPTRGDLLLVAVLALWALLEALLGEGPGPRWLRVLVALGYTLPLIWRRQAPLPAMLAIASVAAARFLTADVEEQGAMPFPSLLVATFSVALHVRSLALAAAGGLVPVVVFAVAATSDGWAGDLTVVDVTIITFFIASAWSAGRLVHRRALQVDAAEAAVGERARDAVVAERARIARELHDIVAHSVSIIAMQAGAADELVERDPAQAHEHMRAVRRTAREALVEMRRLLEVLREDEPVYVPQPGLARVGELVEEARSTGLPVELVEEGDSETVPAGIDLAAYRILQEALTNVRKHAGPVQTRVHVRSGPARIELEVVNEPGSTGNGGGSGRGLIGMRERVRVYGGSVDAGPEPDGGFAVRASLPLEESAA
jgi:signal transduction histidine kinase